MRKPGLERMHLNSQLLKLHCFHASQEESFQTYSEHIQLLSSNLKIPWISRKYGQITCAVELSIKPMPSLSPGLFLHCASDVLWRQDSVCSTTCSTHRLSRDDVTRGRNIPNSWSLATRQHDGVGRWPPAPVPSQNSGVVC